MGGSMMIKIVLAGAFALTAMTASFAQDFTAAQREACKTDYESFCKGTMPGGGRVIACLSKNNDKLSGACKKVVADASKK
jgi:hypothetical protein